MVKIKNEGVLKGVNSNQGNERNEKNEKNEKSEKSEKKQEVEVMEFRVSESERRCVIQAQSSTKISKMKIVADCCRDSKVDSIIEDILTPQEMRDMIVKRRNKNLRLNTAD